MLPFESVVEELGSLAGLNPMGEGLVDLSSDDSRFVGGEPNGGQTGGRPDHLPSRHIDPQGDAVGRSGDRVLGEVIFRLLQLCLSELETGLSDFLAVGGVSQFELPTLEFLRLDSRLQIGEHVAGGKQPLIGDDVVPRKFFEVFDLALAGFVASLGNANGFVLKLPDQRIILGGSARLPKLHARLFDGSQCLFELRSSVFVAKDDESLACLDVIPFVDGDAFDLAGDARGEGNRSTFNVNMPEADHARFAGGDGVRLGRRLNARSRRAATACHQPRERQQTDPEKQKQGGRPAPPKQTHHACHAVDSFTGFEWR
jgi:hypothetical protein